MVTSVEPRNTAAPEQDVAANASSPAARQRALFLGVTYAGHGTRFANLREHTQADGRLDARFSEVNGWREGGVIERLPLPAGARGRLRSMLQSSSFAAWPRPDVIWSSAVETLTPYLGVQIGPLRRPVLLDMDWTVDQGEQFAREYFGREPRRGLRLRLQTLQERALWRSVTRFLPWSRWAADSLRRHGIEEARITVIPPGVDLSRWRPAARTPGDVLRLLFVGGDFRRKGGDMLIDTVRADITGRFELDIVTRDHVESGPRVRVHSAEANSPALMALYEAADIFVLPTRAEAFGIATTEALASGLPAIVSDIGGARDIIDPGETGWLIQPARDSLAAALDAAWTARASLPDMGRRARAVAESRFDGARNDRTVIDRMIEEGALAKERRRGRGG